VEIILIAAMAANWVIGRDGTIPWTLPEEQQRFKEITLGHAVIMGRKTYESIGRPLVHRRNLVISRKTTFSAPGCRVFPSLEQALSWCREQGEEKAFLIGGEAIYREGMQHAHRIVLSILDINVAGDTFFPDIPDSFTLKRKERIEGAIPYTFTVWQRNAAS